MLAYWGITHRPARLISRAVVMKCTWGWIQSLPPQGINLTDRIAATAFDPRNQKKINHIILAMLFQRVYGLALGYEDLNDHDTLRNDTAIQTSVGKDENLASSPTLSRFENFADRQMCWDMS